MTYLQLQWMRRLSYAVPYCVALVGLCAAGIVHSAGAADNLNIKQAGKIIHQDAMPLEPGKPVERGLVGGQSHDYRITLAAGQYLYLVVEQRGIDVVATLLEPDGKKVIEVNSHDGPQGSELVSVIVEVTGIFRLEVRSPEKDAAVGRYEIKIVELRDATERDRALAEALRLYNESVRLSSQGKYNEAIPLAERALEIREKGLDPGHADVALALNALGELYYYKGDYALAESFFQRALAIREKVLGPDHPEVADLINNLAVLAKEKADYTKAEAFHNRALAIREKTFGPDHINVANSLNNLSLLLQMMGDYTRAEPLIQRALSIREKALGPNHLSVATSSNNLAMLYHFKGDYTKAESLYQRALTIREKTLGPDHPEVATTLNNLALLYLLKRDHTKAETFLLRALMIREKKLGPEHPNVAQSLHNLASLHFDNGDHAKAEPLFQSALAILEKSLGTEHPRLADTLYYLASLYHAKGDYEKAEPMYQRALAIKEKSLGAKHPAVAVSLYGLATHYAARGDIAQAVSFQSRASVVSERNFALNLATGSERQKLAYLTQLAAQPGSTISLHVHSAPNDLRALRLATATILQQKGRILDAMFDSHYTLRSRFNAQDQALLDQLKDLNAKLARLVLDGPQRATPAEHQKQVIALEEQKEKLEADISSSSAEFRAQSQPVTLEAVQAAIPTNAAVIEFFSYRRYDVKYSKLNEAFGPWRYVVYVLWRHGEPRWVELGEAKAIDDAVDALRRALRDPKRTDVKRLARKVDEQVMRPVRALLGKTRRVLISPDGALNLVPFAALVDERNWYLVTRYSFSYLTSGRDLLRLQVKQESKSEDLVLADPAYGEKEADDKTRAASRDIVKKTQEAKTDAPQLSQSVSMDQVYFPPLPGTAGEAEAMKRLLPQARVLTQEQATEGVLKQVSRPHILHIATHGYFLRDLELPTANTLTSESPRLAELTPGGEKIENPLLRSGLALAGANLRKSGEEDGILTALEAAGLDLWGTKLVVMSACDTGIGEVKNGEGVYGLRRALVLAGSETQVMSLWPVSDTATRGLMVDYYRRLQRAEGRAEALRQVQLQMLRNPKRQHPYYWASFIQSGEWANLDGKR